MKHAMGLLIAVMAVFSVLVALGGSEAAYVIGYGAVAVMALLISATFMWLWYQRSTPLALGMAFSWSGAASVLGWWWMFYVLNRPEAMVESHALLIFVSLYFVGAVLHFGVMQRSMQLHAGLFALPVAAAVVIASLVYAFY